MYRALMLLMLATLASCSWVPSASDPAHIGMIVALQGDPHIIRDNIDYGVVADVALKVRDVVRTGPGDAVTLRMRDKTLITLGEGTDLAFHIYSEVTPSPLARLSLGHGAVKITPGKMLDEQQARFEVATPVADIRLEAGEMWAAFDDQLVVALLSSGKASLVNSSGQTIISQARESARAAIGEAPSEPVISAVGELAAVPVHLRK